MLNGIPRILIVRLSAIGDVVRVLPALHALRDRFPNAQIDWAVEPKSASVIEGHPALDQVLLFERELEGFLANKAAFRAFCRRVRASRYDIAVDFHGILKSGWILRASRATDRYGFAPPRAREMSHFFTNHRASLPSQRLNRIDENLELVKLLGAKRHDLDVTIPVADEVVDEVDGYLDSAFAAGKRLALLHAPVDRPEKQWPLARFAALADRLLADGRFEVLLTWGPGQRGQAAAVAESCTREPTIAPETLKLSHFAALVRRAHVFCSGDTGPMHIASAMGAPVVAIFGGTDPAKHAPFRKPSELLYEGPKDFPAAMDLATATKHLAAVSDEAAYDACIRITRK